MIAGLYEFLETVGFSHPLHPILVHVPMGMVIGAVLFSLAGFIWKNQNLGQTAYHCSWLALIVIVPTLIAGALDWQQFYDGEWMPLIIIKFVLGVILTGLLAVSVIFKHQGASQQKLLIIYLLCLACAGGLGYSGGELVYG